MYIMFAKFQKQSLPNRRAMVAAAPEGAVDSRDQASDLLCIYIYIYVHMERVAAVHFVLCIGLLNALDIPYD